MKVEERRKDERREGSEESEERNVKWADVKRRKKGRTKGNRRKEMKEIVQEGLK